jgi:hypothetical protein
MLMGSGALAEQMGPGSGLRSPTVNFRLSPDLGEATEEVRAALVGLGPVRIAEPADYELATEQDYPQTLIAVDVRQPQSEWQNDFRQSPPVRRPRTAELGNLTLDDYLPLLRDLVGHDARANLLLAGAGMSDAVETCLADQRVKKLPPPGSRAPPQPVEYCHVGPAGDDTLQIDGQQDVLTVKVRNRTNRPRYVAVVLISPVRRIQSIPFQAGKGGGPLAPGAVAETEDMVPYGTAGVSGNYVLATISSERPIDLTGFVQSDQADELWWNCMRSAARDRCARPAAKLSPDWSISLAEYPYRGPRLVGVGGGEPAMAGMAPWMAEIYSTVPYTKEDLAKDAAKPPGEREHLAEMNSGQLGHRCGGTRIAANFVLTAAHCVAKDHFAGDGMKLVMKERRVRLGTKLLGKGGTTYAIAAVAVPTTYVPGQQVDDIALLMLRPDRGTRTIADSKIALGQKPISAGTGVTAYGWGYTGAVVAGKDPLFNMAEELQRYPDMLRFGRMEALGWDACRKRLRRKLGPGMVCLVAPGAAAGSTPERNVFSCRGDSGGPLTREIGGVEELIGVTSWSMGCGYKDYPSVYTDVTKYRRWIAAAMQQLKPGAALRVDERAAPSEEGRRQQAQ